MPRTNNPASGYYAHQMESLRRQAEKEDVALPNVPAMHAEIERLRAVLVEISGMSGQPSAAYVAATALALNPLPVE